MTTKWSTELKVIVCVAGIVILNMVIQIVVFLLKW